jgi:hypothetical protein
MQPVMSGKCPKCETALRIPTEWAELAIKCKSCGAVVRVKGATTVSPSAPTETATPLPTAVHPSIEMVYDPDLNTYIPAPAGHRAPASYGYQKPGGPRSDFGELESRPSSRRKTKYRKQSGGMAFLVIGLLGLIVAGVIGGLIWQFPDTIEKVTAYLAPNSTLTTPTNSSLIVPEHPGSTHTTKTDSPRRMLAMSITKYLYCNPLVGGLNKNGTSEFNEAVKTLAFRWDIPDTKENNQLFLLTDADGKLMPTAAHRPMLKPIVTETFKQFLSTSRPQDHIVLYFGGHAVAKDGKGYLIPTEGDPNEVDTLIPLEELWGMVKSCPAQQKVVLFDVCRLSTDDNAIRPGSEPMSEELEKLLHSPPDGVQVVTGCSHGQTTGEFRFAPDSETPQGSAFLGALRQIARKEKPTKVNPEDPFPVSEWVESLSKRLKEILGKDLPSVPKSSGTSGTAIAISTTEPAAKRFEYPPVPNGADAKDVKAALAVLDAPPLLGAPPAIQESIESIVVFSAERMKAFKTTSTPEDEAKDEAKYPWRSAALKAMNDLRARWKGFAEPQRDSVLRDGLSVKANDELKGKIAKEQKPLSELSLDLQDMVDTLTDLREQAEKDESKFWVATFRFVLAQAKIRLAFSHEANLALGSVRTDSLPSGSTGWRLVQISKMKARTHAAGAKEAQQLLDELAKECKGTPWEVAAKQWRGVSIGLDWRVKKADADTTTTTEEKK